MAPTRRRTSAVVGLAATAGLCFIPSNQLHCQSFSSSTTRSSRPAGDCSSRGAAGLSSRSAVRSRHSSTRVCSTTVEDAERAAAGAARVNDHQTLQLINVDPETILFGTPAAAAVPTEPATSSTGSVHSGGGAGSDALHPANFDAVADMTDGLTAPETESGAQPLSSRSNSNSPATEKRKRKQRKGKDPEVVEGDDLANTPKMIALVWSSLVLNFAYLLQAFFAEASSSPLEALGTAGAGAFVGYLIADLFSGLLHWSLDNYGGRSTPVFGAIIDSFQGHHASPWTITHRPFENNVHKVTYAALPLLALLRLADPGLFGVALGVAFLFGSLMSNEFHKYSHMVDPPPLAQAFQLLGLSISRKQHGRHHSGTFDEKYCLVSGICNGPMDNFGVFRFLERGVYEASGVEPVAWKLDPSLKGVALSTGWLPFAAARVEADVEARPVGGGGSAEVDPTS